jgi:hypothetical protein
MPISSLRLSGIAFIGMMVLGMSAANAETPKAHDVLFNRPHIASVEPGTELIYKFVRKPSNEKIMGPGYSDDIKVKIESNAADGKKNVLVQVFSGDRARDPQQINGMDGNPMLIVYLDDAVSHFRQIAGGDAAYLKGTFGRYLGNGASIAPATITYKGQQVEGYKVTATPYANDPSKSKMGGFEVTTFTIALSDKIPGYLAQMVSNYTSTDKSAPSVLETTTLEGVGDVK